MQQAVCRTYRRRAHTRGGGVSGGARLTVALAAAVVAVAGTVVGCDFREGGGTTAGGGAQSGRETTRTQAQLLSEGKQVFAADFEGPNALNPEVWNDTSGGAGWVVREGQLFSKGTRNKALWLKHPLPEQVRVEFEARSGSLEGDIKFEVFGDGQQHESGYIAIFGGWKNQLNIIARLDEHGEDRCVMNRATKVCRPGPAGRQRVVQDKVYRMALVRVDHVVRWFVDGELFLEYADPAPLVGERHRHLAFNDWAVPLWFDNLKVFDLGQ